nr:immunoglobulin heavy chain junction region [Mus musculus]
CTRSYSGPESYFDFW